MSILQEIHTWSKSLAPWQQDAIARLYANRTLLPKDLDDLYALAKTEMGISDTQGRTPRALAAAQVASPPTSTRLVQICAIKETSNINALANGSKLPVAASGLTVIYGENGAGKSGYSRALKHACRARDQREEILPNVKLDPQSTGPTTAIFETLIDGKPADLPWKYPECPPEPLSEISIFDTHCARAYIDNEGDFAYNPYGLDILANLVSACNSLRERATQEKKSATPTDAAYAQLAKEGTAVGKALMDIPLLTKAEDIEQLATLSHAEQERLAFLKKALAEADPKQKAQAMRQKATRLVGLITRINNAEEAIGVIKTKDLRTIIDAMMSAHHAAEIASSDFRNTPGQLPGTGGEEWKALFEAARAFAALSHAEFDFPNLPAESACPLCQNSLNQDGARRLRHFDAFIQKEVEKAARDAKIRAAVACKAVTQSLPDLAIDESLSQELAEIGPELSASCSTMQSRLNERRIAILEASTDQRTWETIPAMPSDPRPALTEASTQLQEQAKAMDALVDEKAKAIMTSEYTELDARRRLGEIKDAVLEVIQKHNYCIKLQKCIDGMGTTGISRKSTELSRTMATQELANALNEELKLLKVHELKVAMKPESPGGRTQFKLTLQLPGGGAPSTILSEGEQRAVAIASFLAEVRLGKGKGGVVFDDPVSSLDHRRRWEVAERLATESKTRQVIVFTHDIYFLCILEQKAEELGTTLAKQYIRRTPAGYGVGSDALPFDVLGTKARIGRLRNMLVDVQKAHKSGDDDGHRRLTCDAYGMLRMTWERSVEEVLFQGTIQRFGEGVSTQKLRQVMVTDDDYKSIEKGMAKSSKFEHDASPATRLPVPSPDDLSSDIETLDTWRKGVEDRKSAVASTR